MASAASGGFRRNTARQDTASASQPPRSGPRAVVTPDRPAHAPIARPCSSGEKQLRREGEAARHEQRRPDALHAAEEDQRAGGRREAAEERGEREPDEPDGEHAPAPVAIAERTRREQERGQREEVRVEHVLQLAQGRVELLRQHRDDDVHDRGVDERERRAQDRDEEHAPPRSAVVADRPAHPRDVRRCARPRAALTGRRARRASGSRRRGSPRRSRDRWRARGTRRVSRGAARVALSPRGRARRG